VKVNATITVMYPCIRKNIENCSKKLTVFYTELRASRNICRWRTACLMARDIYKMSLTAREKWPFKTLGGCKFLHDKTDTVRPPCSYQRSYAPYLLVTHKPSHSAICTNCEFLFLVMLQCY